MSDQLTNLEIRIKVLEDIEAIKALKSKYFRCLDKELWDELSECFCEDALLDFGSAKQFKGRKAIVDDFRTRYTARGKWCTGIHHGHNPELKITGQDTAKGAWQLFHYFINSQTNQGARLAGFYDDEYSIENGKWKIKVTKFARVFKEEFARDGLSLV